VTSLDPRTREGRRRPPVAPAGVASRGKLHRLSLDHRGAVRGVHQQSGAVVPGPVRGQVGIDVHRAPGFRVQLLDRIRGVDRDVLDVGVDVPDLRVERQVLGARGERQVPDRVPPEGLTIDVAGVSRARVGRGGIRDDRGGRHRSHGQHQREHGPAGGPAHGAVTRSPSRITDVVGPVSPRRATPPTRHPDATRRLPRHPAPPFRRPLVASQRPPAGMSQSRSTVSRREKTSRRRRRQVPRSIRVDGSREAELPGHPHSGHGPVGPRSGVAIFGSAPPGRTVTWRRRPVTLEE
jgi:hypothetical protein